jgi:hypothetical protein
MSTSTNTISPADARVGSVLNGMTLDELSLMQDVLLEQLRLGLPPSEQIADALERQSAEVAAWFRLRESPNPSRSSCCSQPSPSPVPG